MAVDREIMFVLRMRNEATAAIRSLANDLRSLNSQSTAAQSSNGSASAASAGYVTPVPPPYRCNRLQSSP